MIITRRQDHLKIRMAGRGGVHPPIRIILQIEKDHRNPHTLCACTRFSHIGWRVSHIHPARDHTRGLVFSGGKRLCSGGAVNLRRHPQRKIIGGVAISITHSQHKTHRLPGQRAEINSNINDAIASLMRPLPRSRMILASRVKIFQGIFHIARSIALTSQRGAELITGPNFEKRIHAENRCPCAALLRQHN